MSAQYSNGHLGLSSEQATSLRASTSTAPPPPPSNPIASPSSGPAFHPRPASSPSSQHEWEPEWGWFPVRIWKNYPSEGDMFKLSGEGLPPPALISRHPDREFWEDYIDFGTSADGAKSYISSRNRPMIPVSAPTSVEQSCLRRARTSLLLRIDELCRGYRIKDSVREEGNAKQAGFFAPGDREDMLFYGNLLRKSVNHSKEVLDAAAAAVEGTERRRSEWDQKKLDFYRNHFGVMTQIGSFGGPITFALLFADSAHNDPSLPYRIVLAWASCCFFGGLAVAAGCQITTSSLGSGEWVLEDHEPYGMRRLKLKGSLEDHGEGSRARILGDVCGMLNLMGVVLLVSTIVIYLDWAGRLAGIVLLVGLFTSLMFSSRTVFLAHRRWFRYLYRTRREFGLATLRFRHWISPLQPYSRRIQDVRGGWVFVDRWDIKRAHSRSSRDEKKAEERVWHERDTTSMTINIPSHYLPPHVDSLHPSPPLLPVSATNHHPLSSPPSSNLPLAQTISGTLRSASFGPSIISPSHLVPRSAPAVASDPPNLPLSSSSPRHQLHPSQHSLPSDPEILSSSSFQLRSSTAINPLVDSRTGGAHS